MSLGRSLLNPKDPGTNSIPNCELSKDARALLVTYIDHINDLNMLRQGMCQYGIDNPVYGHTKCNLVKTISRIFRHGQLGGYCPRPQQDVKARQPNQYSFMVFVRDALVTKLAHDDTKSHPQDIANFTESDFESFLVTALNQGQLMVVLLKMLHDLDFTSKYYEDYAILTNHPEIFLAATNALHIENSDSDRALKLETERVLRNWNLDKTNLNLRHLKKLCRKFCSDYLSPGAKLQQIQFEEKVMKNKDSFYLSKDQTSSFTSIDSKPDSNMVQEKRIVRSMDNIHEVSTPKKREGTMTVGKSVPGPKIKMQLSVPGLASSSPVLSGVTSKTGSNSSSNTLPRIRSHARSVSDTSSLTLNNGPMRNEVTSLWQQASSLTLSPAHTGSETSSELFETPPSPPAGGWKAPRPMSPNQTLHSYIASGEFSKHQAQLDRENAHLLLSEAVIQGLNKANFEKVVQVSSVLAPNFISQELYKSTYDDGLNDLDAISGGHDSSKITSQNVFVSEPKRGMCTNNSAESLALTLLAKSCANLKMPKVSDLHWLIEDIHSNYNTEMVDSSQSFQGSDNRLFSVRGNEDWAPPRPQLIFEVHEKKKLLESLKEQSFLCRGCGVSVDMKYMKTFRYCNYFGAYFCTSCHTNKESVLPAKIVQKWSFKLETVSDFAYSVISSLSKHRLFDMEMINPDMCQSVFRLRTAIELRRNASRVFPYVLACKHAENEGLRTKAEVYDFEFPSDFTLNELCSIRLGEFNKNLKVCLEKSKNHVLNCKSCHMHGHICEGCRSPDILFPFQSDLVQQCQNCRACFHAPCYPNASSCSKCLRIAERKEKRLNLPEMRD